jgi:putative ABC transport system ATP-binding protein
VSAHDAQGRLLAVEGVTKTYGEGEGAVAALRGVDLAVKKGELWILRGPSGCGKTTLLQILGCVLKPTSGRVFVEGRDVTQLSESERAPLRLNTIGFVFQEPGLFDALTTTENVALPLRLRGMSRSQARDAASVALQSVGLGTKLNMTPRQLSGGQRQRVGIARALAGAPSILLADEPTAALDSSSGAAVMDLISTLCHEHGHTALIVTHDARITHYADQLVEIEDGRIRSMKEAA